MTQQCPWCSIRLYVDEADVPRLDRSNAGVCTNCGHVMVIVNSMQEGLFHTKPDLDYLHDAYSPEQQKLLHEIQEKVHHDLGQWG